MCDIIGLFSLAAMVDAVVKQELDSPSPHADVEIVPASKVKKTVSDKRRKQIQDAEKNRKNKVRSRVSSLQVKSLEQEKDELTQQLEGLRLGQHYAQEVIWPVIASHANHYNVRSGKKCLASSASSRGVCSSWGCLACLGFRNLINT